MTPNIAKLELAKKAQGRCELLSLMNDKARIVLLWQPVGRLTFVRKRCVSSKLNEHNERTVSDKTYQLSRKTTFNKSN